MVQTATTGQIENASKEMIGSARYTIEHNAPVYATCQHDRLGKGEDTGVFLKVGQMSMSDLEDGRDMIDEEEIALSTVSVTTAEVGAKIILTDKMMRQQSKLSFSTVGRQMGDGYKRKREDDGINLFSGLNGGTSLGAAAADFSVANATACVSVAKTQKMGEDLMMIQHPNAVMRLAKDLSTIGSGVIRPLPEGYSARLLSKVWKGYTIWDVPVIESGNISRDSTDDAIGVIKAKEAIGYLESKSFASERERDASLRAWEVNFVADYAAFENDDSLGAPLTFDAANPSTSA
jgi:hypothetical protein